MSSPTDGQPHRCILCGDTTPPQSEAWWEIPAWDRWAHPSCFREIMADVRAIGQAEMLAMIEEKEREHGWTDTRVGRKQR